MRIFIIILAVLFTLPSSCFAGRKAPAFYISGSAGVFAPSDAGITDTDQATQNLLTLAGISKREDVFETGFSGSVALGTQAHKRLRIEGEYSLRTADREKRTISTSLGDVSVQLPGEVLVHSFMLNSIFDFRNSTRFTPYLGAGVGVDVVEFENPRVVIGGIVVNSFDDTDSVFAYQVIAGVGYWITRHLVGFAEYRYRGSDDLEFDTTIAEFASHNAGVGIRYYFGKP